MAGTSPWAAAGHSESGTPGPVLGREALAEEGRGEQSLQFVLGWEQEAPAEAGALLTWHWALHIKAEQSCTRAFII